MSAEIHILSLSDVPLEAAAGVLTQAFYAEGHNGLSEWRALLERELAAKRVDGQGSRVARVDGELVGVCLVNPGPDGGGRIGPTGVLPDMHRRGVGSRLVMEAREVLRNAGMPRVTLEVGQVNTAALALYESMGFARTRPLVNLRLRRSALDWPGELPPVCMVSFQDALEACSLVERPRPAFQRQRHYLSSFEEGARAYGVGGPLAWDGVLICLGRAVLDIAVSSPRPAVMSALLLRATQQTHQLRIIHEPSNGGGEEALLALGATVESRAWEMSWMSPA